MCLLCDTGDQQKGVCCVIWWPRRKVCLLCDTGDQQKGVFVV